MANQKTLSNPPHGIPIVNARFEMNRAWVEWFLALYTRVGNEIALTNVELENIQQADLADIQADVTALQTAVSGILLVNTSQGNSITALQASIQGLQLAPVAS